MKSNKVNQLKAGAILTYIAMGIGFIVSLVYTPIMIRLLGQSEYGLYNLAASIIAYLGILNFGFGSTYIRYYSQYKVKEDHEGIAKLNGMFLIIFSVIAVIALFAGFTLAYYSKTVFGSEITAEQANTGRILLIILTINLAIKFPNIVFISYIRANERFVFQKLIELVRIIINPFFILPVLFLGYGSIGMVLATTILSLIIEIVHIWYARRKLKINFNFKEFDKKLFKEMTLFSSFIFLNTVIDQINWNVDKFIIGRFHGTIPVAIYSLGAMFNTYYIQLSTAVSSVFVPRVHKLVQSTDDKKEITKLFTKIGRVQFLILSLFLTGFIFFGKPFIHWWAGDDYAETYYIIVILISGATIPIIQNIGIEVQRAMNLHKFRSLTYLIIAIVNVFITILLVSRFEGIGAALGTAGALLIGNGLIMNIYYHKKVGLNIIYFWKQILKFIPAFILPILTGFVFIQYVDIYRISMFLIGVSIYALVFFTSMWFIGMNDFEKDLIRKPVKTIVGKIRGK